MPVLKTWSVVGERWSRIESMKVMVSGGLELVKGSIDGALSSMMVESGL